LTVVPPPELTDVEIYFTTTMPGFVLEEGKLAGATYVYDPIPLARDFPNLDAGTETITISLFLSGKDASGAKRTLARQLVLQGDEVMMPEPPRKRRAAR
jgi:hypothetical protein